MRDGVLLGSFGKPSFRPFACSTEVRGASSLLMNDVADCCEQYNSRVGRRTRLKEIVPSVSRRRQGIEGRGGGRKREREMGVR